MTNGKNHRLSDLANKILETNYYATYGKVLLFTLLWITILSGWAILRGSYLENHSPLFLDFFAVSVSFIFLGCAGVISALRRELHQIVTVRDRLAIILSILWAITSWGIAGYALYKGIAIFL